MTSLRVKATNMFPLFLSAGAREASSLMPPPPPPHQGVRERGENETDRRPIVVNNHAALDLTLPGRVREEGQGTDANNNSSPQKFRLVIEICTCACESDDESNDSSESSDNEA